MHYARHTTHASSPRLLWLVSNCVQSFMQCVHSLDSSNGCPVWCLHFGLHFPRWNNYYCLTNPRVKGRYANRGKGRRKGLLCFSFHDLKSQKGQYGPSFLLKLAFFSSFTSTNSSIHQHSATTQARNDSINVSHQHTHKDLSLLKSKRMKRDPTRLHHSQLQPPPPLSQPSDCLQT